MIRTDLGIATAYAEAVSKGYTGTRDEFGQMFVDFGKTAEKVTEDKKAVEQMKTSVEEAKNSVDTTAAEFGQNVADKTAEATAAITEHANTEKESATAAISEAKDVATGAITEAQTSATDAIASSKDLATAEITKKGTDTLATIPEDYTALTGQVGSLKEDIRNILSPNLYNPAAAKANVAISSNDGSEMDGFSGWETTDYISVSKNDVLYFSSNDNPTPYSTGAFYDAQKKFISGFGNPNDNNNITVTSDGYARFSFNSKKEKLQIEKGSRTTYVPYGELKFKAEVDNIKKDTGNIKAEVSEVKAEVAKIQEDHTNLFNKDAVTKGAVLSESGYFETSFSSWDSSDYIPVKPEMVLYFSSNELPIGVAST